MKIWHKNTEQKQEENNTENSFVGGFPKLPKQYDLPTTKDTGTQMTFYFQYEFPKEHIYSGYTLSIFATTDFMDDDYTIPEMLEGELKGIDIPEGFLDEYQKYFKVFIYKNGVYPLRIDYQPKLTYKQLITSENLGENSSYFGDINSEPDWYLDDETPGLYNHTEKLFFLIQLKEGYEFEKMEDAPRQQILGGEDGMTLCDSFGSKYDLFNMNEIYFFGTQKDRKSVV